MEATLKRTGQRPLSFAGEVLAQASTSMDRAHPDYSGETGISHKAAVYRTTGGRYVLELNTYSAWQGSTDTFRAEVFDSLEDLATRLEDEAPARVSDELFRQLISEEGIAERLE